MDKFHLGKLAVYPKIRRHYTGPETKPKVTVLTRIGLKRRLDYLIRWLIPHRRDRRCVRVGAITFLIGSGDS